ncbi:unnamed protein product [Oncorhynchus mykiss]|uniref:Uncharacterized protein n=1 Tax=Oncorhynchus mykiss TaxID=8022 RepID=A0A060YPR9_ONCMY|nr:unnamed protein product [Oncorhynchus mykiss]
MMLPCDSFKTIFERLYQALPSAPPETEPVIQAIIDNLMQTAPEDCLPMNMKVRMYLFFCYYIFH